VSRAGALALALAAGVAGFLLGRAWKGPSDRADLRSGVLAPRMVEVEPERYARLQERVARAESLAAENERLQTTLRALRPGTDTEGAGPAPPPGTRLPDGTIVGGARWPKLTTTAALGFLDGMVARFFSEANLSPAQEEKLRGEMEQRIDEVLQVAADFVNGDTTGDQAYDALEGIAKDSREMLHGVLDEEQFGVYRRFESELVGFVHDNVVNNEMAALRKELSLDSAQEQRVREVVEERYRRVQERLHAPIPHMFFKPLRRESDGDIYQETAQQIAEYLTPEQAALFAAAEGKAATSLYDYRSLLVPKTR